MRDDFTEMRQIQNKVQFEQRSMPATDYRAAQPLPRLEALVSDVDRAYRYSGIEYRPQPLHGRVRAILDEVNGFLFEQGEIQAPFDAVFINLYRSGRDSIGWHRDDEPSLGPVGEVQIASLSFGARRRFLLRERANPKNRHPYDLGMGDLLLMQRGCQSAWEHAATKTDRPCGPRMALTFRRFVD